MKHPDLPESIRSSIQLSLQFVLLLALLISGRAGAAAQNVPDPPEDVQIWPEVQVSFRLNNAVKVNLAGTVREGRNLTAVVNENFGGGVTISLGKYFTLSPNYRYVATQPTPTRHSTEHRYILDFTTRLPLPGGIVVSDRTRTEWRDLSGVTSSRYRNRVQLERVFNLREYKITPYSWVELYYDTRYRDWIRTQYAFGARLPLQSHLTLDSYYLKQNDARSKPGYLHVMGMTLRLDF